MVLARTKAQEQRGLPELLEKARAYLPDEGVRLVEEAYEFAQTCHADQKRLSGEPYIIHPLDAAITVAGLQLDAVAVAAALLHDVQEDCGIPNDELERRFGPEVAKLVDGATKLKRITWQSPEERVSDGAAQAENLRKMFLAMAEDVRVVIIKLADRLHNMRTLEYLQPEKRLRVAQETMEIYAPLASRLGIWQIKWELEDLSFRHLEPEKYREISQLIASKRATRERYIAQIEKILLEELAKQEIEASVQGRAKHIYSVYEKMQKYAGEGKSFNEIYDLLALRVLVDSVADCYTALGIIHGLWRPIPGQFDDYVANPRGGVYQSLHTTVMCLDARPLEIQIRTNEMHRLAEYGVAAHWRYKEGGRQDLRFEEQVSWLRQLLEWQREMAHAEDFVETVKTDIFQDQVFVYTPKGEIKDLPASATPIDFAFRIHTELGYHCIGAKVNGRLVALNYPLENGDVVEVLVGRSSRGPSRDWLNPNLGYVNTSHAREKIRQWFRKQERAENIEKGREMLEKELRRLGVTIAQAKSDLLRQFPYESLDDLHAALGFGGASLHQVAVRLTRLLTPEEPKLPTAEPSRLPVSTSAIQVLGTGDLLTQLGRCCNPVPGDDIIGYITRSRGVTVHRRDCFNVLHEDERERLVDVEWGSTGEFFPVAVQIEAWDRVGLLRDVSTVIAEEKVNMVAVRTQEFGDRTTAIYLTLETRGVGQLSRLLSKLEIIRGVISVSRTAEHKRPSLRRAK
ncbi:MAG: bifunctional (p)ppGpp synthetase/guanosine-3',5'-bis(diphosphate) 3'-pyrophosphohydrolase [Dehalococcoidia bacterium]